MERKKIDPRKIALAVAPYESTEPWQGLLKFLLLGLPLALMGYWLIFRCQSMLMACLLAAPYGILYASLLITTHDAIHQTFTGIKFCDEILSRVISWPVYWVHSVYAEVHKLHHNMNGTNLNDPERVQFTVKEFHEGNFALKFFIKYQWFLNLFVFVGLGMIWKTIRYGARFLSASKSMRQAFITDVLGLSFLNGTIIAFAIFTERLEYYVVWYLITQYLVGFVLQLRAHVEHYGLWGKGEHFYDTQVWNCRNMKVPYFVAWYFNFLSFHSIHHAFPKVPFYKLKDAQEAMRQVYKESGKDIPESHLGYAKQAWNLAVNPTLIDDRQNEEKASSNHQNSSAGQKTVLLIEVST